MPSPGPATAISPAAVLAATLLGPPVVGGLAGCGGPEVREPRAATTARDPGAALDRAADDATDTRTLVALLDADDPVVRLAAIAALERRTGDRLGYDPHADRADRRAAMRRWVARADRGTDDAARARTEAP